MTAHRFDERTIPIAVLAISAIVLLVSVARIAWYVCSPLPGGYTLGSAGNLTGFGTEFHLWGPLGSPDLSLPELETISTLGSDDRFIVGSVGNLMTGATAGSFIIDTRRGTLGRFDTEAEMASAFAARTSARLPRRHPPLALLAWADALGSRAVITGSVVLMLGATGIALGARHYQTLAARLRSGRCVACAYDCRGLDTGLCPECGRVNQYAGFPVDSRPLNARDADPPARP